MSPEAKDNLDAALQHVKSNRRDLLKRLLMGGGTIALVTPMMNVLAAGKSNAAILKCIDEKLPGTEGAPLNAKVTGDGVATVTGLVTKAAIRNSATKVAQNCGATKVNNLIKVKGKTPPPPVNLPAK
jgi:hypothetical protein